MTAPDVIEPCPVSAKVPEQSPFLVAKAKGVADRADFS